VTGINSPIISKSTAVDHVSRLWIRSPHPNLLLGRLSLSYLKVFKRKVEEKERKSEQRAQLIVGMSALDDLPLEDAGRDCLDLAQGTVDLPLKNE